MDPLPSIYRAHENREALLAPDWVDQQNRVTHMPSAYICVTSRAENQPLYKHRILHTILHTLYKTGVPARPRHTTRELPSYEHPKHHNLLCGVGEYDDVVMGEQMSHMTNTSTPHNPTSSWPTPRYMFVSPTACCIVWWMIMPKVAQNCVTKP